MKERLATPPAPVILALDTSSKTTGLAVARGDRLLAESCGEPDEKRSEKLWTEVAALLDGVGLSIKDVDLFAVCVGPGGFTGLRVGLAAVKGYAYAAGRPAIGVTSLEAAAFAAGPAPAVCAMTGAYKGEVYAQAFAFDADGVPVPLGEPVAATVEQVLAGVAGYEQVVFAGSAAREHAEDIRQVGSAGWTLAEPLTNPAAAIARLAFIHYQRGAAGDAESLRACYVRPADAEVKLAAGLLGRRPPA